MQHRNKSLGTGLYHGDAEDVVSSLGPERSRWREAINAYPARLLQRIRKAAGLSLSDACPLVGVSVREWAFAERGQNPEAAWKLYGAIGGEALGDVTLLASFLEGAMMSGKCKGEQARHAQIAPLGKRWFARYSALGAKEFEARHRHHRLMRSLLTILRKARLRWTAQVVENDFGIQDLNNIEFRMSDESEFLTWRMEELIKSYVVHGYKEHLLYVLEQDGGRSPLQEKAPLFYERMKVGGDIYKCAGMFGMNPKQWWRMEQGVFYAQEEKILHAALLLAMRDSAMMLELDAQREKQTPLYARMRDVRLQAGQGTYGEAARWLAEHTVEGQGEGESAAMKRRLGKKRNTRMACHHWGILENGCAPEMSSDEGLKAVAMGFMSGSAWKHYYNKNLRCG